MRYRDHRGGLAESMETAIDVDGLAGILKHINETFPFNGGLSEHGIRFEYIGDDPRIGWKDVYMVIIADLGVVGFCEGKPA